jgi:predicted nucleotidyltransferase
VNRWPLENYAAVLKDLVKRFDVWPVIFGGHEDQDRGEFLIGHVGRGLNAAGKLDPRATVAAMRQCVLFFGNDTGTMHLAASAGIPCIGIYSARQWRGLWEPYTPRKTILRSEIECEGCGLTECLERQNECLNRISADDVAAACRELLAAEGDGGNVTMLLKNNSIQVPDEARAIGQCLHRELAAERVYLFGSHARGDAGPDSDLDFLVVVPHSAQSRYERAVQAYRVLSRTDHPTEIVVLTRAEWEKEIKAPSSLGSTVLREGIALHNGPRIS